MTAPVMIPKPVPARPLSLFDIVDGAFAILRSRPRTVAGIAAAFVLPSLLLSSFLSRQAYADFNFSDFTSASGGSSANQTSLGGFGLFGGSWVAIFFQYAILPFMGVALTHLLVGWRDGIDRSTKECLLFTLKKTPVIVVAWLLSKVIQLVSLLFATPATMLVAPIVAAEDVGPIVAIKRSIELGRRRYGNLLGLVALVALINLLLTYALLTLPVVGAFLLGDWGWIVFFGLGSVGSTVLALFGVGVAVLAYFDLMDRTEGSDLTRRLALARQRA